MVMKSTNTWRSATNLWLRGAGLLDDNGGDVHRVGAVGCSSLNWGDLMHCSLNICSNLALVSSENKRHTAENQLVQ